MKFRLAHRNSILEPESFPHDGNAALANNFKTYERALFRIGYPQHFRPRIGKQLELRKAGLRHNIFLGRLQNASGGRYRSADLLFSTRSAFRSIDTNFPDASTVKSSHCSTMTAALPSPKWFRSTRFAAASQSGTESAQPTAPGCVQSKKITPSSHEHAATAPLLLAKNHDFPVVFGNLIEELPGAQILHIRLEHRLF